MTKKKIQIKKYGNRRLYNLEEKAYITLEDVQTLIQNNCEVEIVDSKTGEDLTQAVLTQIILENQKQSAGGLFSTQILHQLIQYQDQSIVEFFQEYLPNLLTSYVHWQQQAQNQFMHWAQLGWSANPYAREFFRPGLNFWGMGEMPSPFAASPNGDSPAIKNGDSASIEEMDALKQKIEALEMRLNQLKKRA